MFILPYHFSLVSMPCPGIHRNNYCTNLFSWLLLTFPWRDPKRPFVQIHIRGATKKELSYCFPLLEIHVTCILIEPMKTIVKYNVLLTSKQNAHINGCSRSTSILRTKFDIYVFITRTKYDTRISNKLTMTCRLHIDNNTEI